MVFMTVFSFNSPETWFCWPGKGKSFEGVVSSWCKLRHVLSGYWLPGSNLCSCSVFGTKAFKVFRHNNSFNHHGNDNAGTLLAGKTCCCFCTWSSFLNPARNQFHNTVSRGSTKAEKERVIHKCWMCPYHGLIILLEEIKCSRTHLSICPKPVKINFFA